MRWVLLTASVTALAALGIIHDDLVAWEFRDRLGTIWLQRLQAPPLAGDELCEDVPRIDYERVSWLPLPEGQTSSEEAMPLEELFRVGERSVRPLHIWGVYTDIGCKEPLGWGTAALVGIYKGAYIWQTVEHNVKTSKYFSGIFGREVATNWFVQDADGNFRELFLVGCKDDKFCILVSSYISGAFPFTLETDRITNDVQLFEKTYLYGCSLTAKAVRRYEHYKVMFFCLGNVGQVHSRDRIEALDGGDVLVSNPAMPGFSGSPVFVFRDGKPHLVGTVNAGVEGVFTAVNFVAPDAVEKVQAWLAQGESLWSAP
jgi:hypothetical protein